MDKNRILFAPPESPKTEFGKEELDQQAAQQKVFPAVWALESEVNNGGFSPFFLNESAETASFVVKALEVMGTPRTGATCKSANEAAFLCRIAALGGSDSPPSSRLPRRIAR
jgi:uncharacterized protein DUF4375